MLKKPGCPTLKLCALLQPFASVTVSVYTPLVNAVMSSVLALNAPGPLQAKPYGVVPPVVVAFTAPVAEPPQEAGVTVPMIASVAAGWLIVTLLVIEQPLASVMVQV